MKARREKICIVTADRILAYQPSILNLYDLLSQHFDVEIISLKPAYIAKGIAVTDRTVQYIDTETTVNRLLTFVQHALNFPLKRFSKHIAFISYRFHFSKTYELCRIRKFLKERQYDCYIGVDSYGFFPIQRLKRKGYFFSLELSPTDPYIRKVDTAAIQGIIIQSHARLDYLFPGTQRPVFYIQNAPSFTNIEPPAHRQGLIWAGSIVKEFGVMDLLHFIDVYPQYELYLKGGTTPPMKQEIVDRYKDLIASGNVIFDTRYIPDVEFYAYLSAFRIGFCFYDWDLIRANYNYFTAPSGKLYAYYVAGVPVIAPDIEGMSSVREFGTGVLVADYKPKTIQAAITEIEKDHARYVANCTKAAQHFSFSRMAAPFLQHLLESRSGSLPH